jgi:alpha-mannosidase
MDCFFAGKGTPDCVKECRRIAATYLGDKIDSSAVYDGDDGIVYGVGNCHIDTCWLWPWAETKRKVARSWANQCNLIERYVQDLCFVGDEIGS